VVKTTVANRYTAMPLADVIAEFDAIARESAATFGRLDGSQLNWRPDAAKWSVAQCFDHLLNANRAMFQAIDAAIDPSAPRTFWQRVPLLPRLFGRILVQSQAPDAKRKFTAPAGAVPAASTIDAGITERFIAHQHEAALHVQTFAHRDIGEINMVSPFVSFITYSVLDGCRLIVTHERRHLEQARRVMQAPGFPSRAA
jgi:hypothetical protein